MSASDTSIPTRQDVERRIGIFLAPMVLIASGLVGVLVALDPLPQARHVPIWVLVPAFIVCLLVEIRLRVRGRINYFNLAGLPLTVGLFVLEPLGLLVCYLGSALIAMIVQRMRPAIICANVICDAVSISVGIIVFQATAGSTEVVLLRSPTT